jgi:hypothetical protein
MFFFAFWISQEKSLNDDDEVGEVRLQVEIDNISRQQWSINHWCTWPPYQLFITIPRTDFRNTRFNLPKSKPISSSSWNVSRSTRTSPLNNSSSLSLSFSFLLQIAFAAYFVDVLIKNPKLEALKIPFSIEKPSRHQHIVTRLSNQIKVWRLPFFLSITRRLSTEYQNRVSW